jgi:hypothetical protein
MTLKRLFVIFAAVAIMGAGLFMVLQNKQPTPAELLQAEQEVYAALLSYQNSTYTSEYVYGTVIDKHQLVEYTNSGELQGNTPLDGAGYPADFDDGFSSLQQSTWKDYEEKNKVSLPIKELLPPTADVVFVDPANGEQLYWWVSFSRIGFNFSLTQALVLVGDCRGDACFDSTGEFMYSMGDYFLLGKVDGKWVIQDSTMAWLTELPSP